MAIVQSEWCHTEFGAKSKFMASMLNIYIQVLGFGPFGVAMDFEEESFCSCGLWKGRIFCKLSFIVCVCHATITFEQSFNSIEVGVSFFLFINNQNEKRSFVYYILQLQKRHSAH